MTMTDAELARFLSKVDCTGEHWMWTAGLHNEGYGYFKLHGRNQLAHRVAYEHFIGPIPETLTIDHLCRVRACCRPDHLEPVPIAVNLLRGVSPAADNARKTHCPRRHQLSGNNVYDHRPRKRECLSCRRESARRWRHEHLERARNNDRLRRVARRAA